MKLRTTVAFLAVLSLGFALGWFTRGITEERATRGLILAYQLERLSFSANCITLFSAGRDDSLQNVLWLGISSSLASAEEQTAAGAVIEPSLPITSFLDGVERACIVAQKSEKPDLAARLEALHNVVADR